MNENIKIMLEKLIKDEETQKKLAATRDPDEAYAIASALHGGYTKEEFFTVMQAIQEQQAASLDEADLAKTAGGGEEILEILETVTAVTCTGSAISLISYTITAAAF